MTELVCLPIKPKKRNHSFINCELGTTIYTKEYIYIYIYKK